MPDLREQLESCCRGRVCLVGVGNADGGDDGFGVRLTEALAGDLRFAICDLRVVVAGRSPERHLAELNSGGFDHVIFLDAVEFGGEPGSVIFLGAGEMAARFPQISTHKISLGTLAKWIEANGTTRAWLLGVQPASLKAEEKLSPAVQTSLELMVEIVGGQFGAQAAGGRADGAQVCQPRASERAALGGRRLMALRTLKGVRANRGPFRAAFGGRFTRTLSGCAAVRSSRFPGRRSPTLSLRSSSRHRACSTRCAKWAACEVGRAA